MFPKHYVDCENCGKNYRVSPSAITDINYCSVSCMSKHMKGVERPDLRTRVTVQCAVCNKHFERQPNQLKNVNKTYCSRDCFAIGHRERMSGDKNPSWRGGFDPYYGANWKQERLVVLERDDYTCQHCGIKDNLHVHHIKPLRFFKRNFKSANKPSNLVTLCRSCHKKEEWRMDK